jgi:hypothetical protein
MYEIIKDKLAVEGIGEDYHPMPEGFNHPRMDGWYQVDARVLSDLGEENEPGSYKELISLASVMLRMESKCVIVCGAGQSRSNAIAVGVLVSHFDMDFYDAWELVKEKNPTCYIDPSHISHLKKIFKVTLP